MSNQFFTPAQVEVITSIVEETISKKQSKVHRDFVPVQEWAKENSVSLSKLYGLKSQGVIKFYKFGKLVFLRTDEVQKLMHPA